MCVSVIRPAAPRRHSVPLGHVPTLELRFTDLPDCRSLASQIGCRIWVIQVIGRKDTWQAARDRVRIGFRGTPEQLDIMRRHVTATVEAHAVNASIKSVGLDRRGTEYGLNLDHGGVWCRKLGQQQWHYYCKGTQWNNCEGTWRPVDLVPYPASSFLSRTRPRL